ncbi:deoxyribonuclease V [Mucilaginibacter arboris]|uniref:Endonuclease V n=1 Tax=Mucilaginibacter arboris TaxID=2682090 RepID=A0A7K1T006_9SPHI|nr:deoxyribonuclease V [Mucilaginibacter arboris]MVN22896.1 deoxyribonuclease V [Mucilaginibacter arboris]
MPLISPEEYENLTPVQAIELQQQLRKEIRIEPLLKPIQTIAGADISFNKYEETVYAGIIVLSFPPLQEVAKATVISKTSFPYIPGLLSFREIPSLLKAWGQLEVKPDLMVLDGQGIAHPRRMGIATHFGLVTDTPAMGCAKSLLTGKFEALPETAGSASLIYDQEEVIGAALRTKNKVNPVFISPGHRITLEQSLAIIKQCISGYRIPDPTRKAHLLVNLVRTQNMGDKRSTQLDLF